ncbi:MAG: hypothetical protein ACK5XB_00785 [Rhodospirillales bacterium]
MIKQHQFAQAFGLPNSSPFCVKLKNYLRMPPAAWINPPPEEKEPISGPVARTPN